MKRSFLFCTLPVSFVILPAVGLLLFTSGFFLTRLGIEEKSEPTISLFPADPRAEVLTYNEFVRYNRVVILLIDALRYDFVKNVAREDITEIRPYHNHMNTITHLTESSPRNAKLYKFLADPPTTTMQRIKGLTTGSLPTFVDQTSNFNSPRITEDTFLHQITRSGRNAVFAGDDTWMDLFPDSFSEAYPYPSFNVKDLHTVDEGVIRHLFPFLERRDWSLLIGHFLGVDHCGHIYGPDHSSMKDKLIQLDGVISSVVEQLPDDALLVVMGDHGMTETGDHGGDTANETNAALFLYSSRALLPSPAPSDIVNSPLFQTESVSQKNIVPTISLLLGLPIPYSNLGSLIPELFLKDGNVSSLLNLSRAMLVNCLQVWRYLSHYSLLSSDIPQDEMTSFQRDIDYIISLYTSDNIDSTNSLLELLQKCTEFLRRSEYLCQSIWAKFNITSMVSGISVLIFTTFLHVLISSNLSPLVETQLTHNVIVLGSSTCVLLASYLISTDYLGDHVEDDLAVILLTILLISLWLVSVTYTFYYLLASRDSILIWLRNSGSILSTSSLVLSLLSSFSLFSNSYIIWEDTRLGYLLQTYNCIILFRSLSGWYTESKENKSSVFTHLFNPVLLIGLMALSRIFHVCRPEQFPCESSPFSLPLLNLSEKSFISAVLRLFLSILLLLLPTLLLCRKYKLSRNRYYPLGLFIMCFLIVLFWITRLVPQPSLSPTFLSLYHTSAPRIIYLISIFLSIYSIWNLWDIKHKADSVIHNLSLHYSCLCLVVWLLSCLLVGDGMVPSLALSLLYIIVLSKALAGYKSSLFLSHYWFLLSSKFYFTIGHQFTVQSIRYEAAFIGFHGHLDSFMVAGFLIGINMFATYICNMFILPLFLSQTSTKRNSRQQTIVDNPLYNITCTILLILSFTNFQVLLACSVAFTHRRHLMVWNVFAPRFVYEAVIYCVLVVVIIIVYSIVYPTIKSFDVKESSSIKIQ